MDSVAFETSAIDAYPSRSHWDAAAADLVATMLHRWHLTAVGAFVGGEAASVLRVTTSDGQPAVLKVGFPHVEAIWEAVALQAWGPGLAPGVLRQDPWTWTMLLEAVEPGIPLSRAGVPAAEALDTAARLYRGLSARPVPAGLPALGDVAGDYLRDATARLPVQHAVLVELGTLPLFERGLAETAELASTDGAAAFLHGDFNPGNLLLDRRDDGDRWLAIDPKPMRGDREFDLFPLVEQLGSPWASAQPVEALVAQLGAAAELIGCDYTRSARWAFARSALNLSWYLDDGNRDAAVAAVRQLRTWAQVIGS